MTTRMHEVYGWNQGSEACTELFLVHVLCFERECMCARASDGRCVTFLFFFLRQRYEPIHLYRIFTHKRASSRRVRDHPCVTSLSFFLSLSLSLSLFLSHTHKNDFTAEVSLFSFFLYLK